MMLAWIVAVEVGGLTRPKRLLFRSRDRNDGEIAGGFRKEIRHYLDRYLTMQIN